MRPRKEKEIAVAKKAKKAKRAKKAKFPAVVFVTKEGERGDKYLLLYNTVTDAVEDGGERPTLVAKYRLDEVLRVKQVLDIQPVK